jgi:methyl-accepting chemotaxis protein
MTLRTRLLIGYSYLVTLVLITAGVAALGYARISKVMEQTMEHQSQAIQVAVDLMDALAVQNAAVLSLWQEPEDGALRSELRAAAETFTNALDRLQGLMAGQEGFSIDGLRAAYRAYQTGRETFLAARREDQNEVYQSHFQPGARQLREEVGLLLDSQYNALVAAEMEVRERAIGGGLQLGVLVLVVLLSLALVSVQLRRRVLAPLDELRSFCQAQALGDDQRRLQLDQSDDLGWLGRQINTALDRRDEMEAQSRNHMTTIRQSTLALLDRIPEPAALVGLDGYVLASTWLPEQTGRSHEVAEAVRNQTRQLDPDISDHARIEYTHRLPDGGKLRLELLRAEGKRPVAWLVRWG